MANPITDPDLWDQFALGDQVSPGIIPFDGVTGWTRKREWDVKKTKGADGATITDQGAAPAEGSIKLHLWRHGEAPDFIDDFEDWEQFQGHIKTVKGNTSSSKLTALSIIHPDINQLGIYAVVVKSVGQLVHEGGGLYSATIELLEYFPAKPAGGTPTKWIETAKPDPLDATIKALLKKAEAP